MSERGSKLGLGIHDWLTGNKPVKTIDWLASQDMIIRSSILHRYMIRTKGRRGSTQKRVITGRPNFRLRVEV